VCMHEFVCMWVFERSCLYACMFVSCTIVSICQSMLSCKIWFVHTKVCMLRKCSCLHVCMCAWSRLRSRTIYFSNISRRKMNNQSQLSCVHVCMCLYICMYACYVRICVFLYVCNMCVLTHVCVCIYACTHIYNVFV
jgi:hypothetical protein